MKWSQFFGGPFIGTSIGLMVGAAIVRLPEDGSGQRAYPVFPSMVLAIAGVGAAGIGRRRSGRSSP
jgi:hypothetical protein